jgi:hypothetical protein
MTQTEWVLKEGKRKWITPLDAYLGCGCLRLAARILDLKREGYTVSKKTIHKNGKNFAAYRVRNKNVRQH